MKKWMQQVEVRGVFIPEAEERLEIIQDRHFLKCTSGLPKWHFNPVALWLHKSHLNHIWAVLRIARHVFTLIKLRGLACFQRSLERHTQSPNLLLKNFADRRNIAWEILERFKYFRAMAGARSLTLCHVSSFAHVQKGLEKESLSSN